MVCHRWTLALILIFVPILVTVVSAFRVSLPGRSQEVKPERRHKCEDCGVSDRNLDPVVHSFKKESAKRSFDDIKKVFSDKRYAFTAKLTKKDEPDDLKIDNDDNKDSDSVKASFERLEKVETKIKLDTKPRTKKVSLILDFNDDDDDDDDSEVENDDDYDLPKLPVHKKPVVVDSKKKIDEPKSTAPVKPAPKLKDNKDEIKDGQKDTTLTQIKQKIDVTNVKTVIKESLKSKAEFEKPLKATPKPEIEKKSDKENDLKQSLKESDLPKIKIISKPKDTSTKDPIVSEPNQKSIKIKITEKDDGKSKQKSTDSKEPLPNSKEKDVENDALKIKKIPESKKSVETTSEKKVDSKRETTKAESENSRLHQLSDALHRRNLLHSRFEDLYAFFPTFAPNFSRVHNPECRRHGQILLRQLRGTKLWALNMLDATAKIPSGLLQGNGIQLGDFDQCLGIRARVQLDTGSIVRVQGKYCLAMIDLKAEHPALETPVHLAQSRNLFKSRIDDPGHFVPRFSTLSWGVCVPSPCSPDDVEVILRDAVKHYQYKTGISIRVKVDEHDCYARKGASWWKEWLDLPTILTLSLYATVLTLVLIATLQDYLSTNNSEEEPSDEGKSEEEETEVEEKKEKKTSDGFLSSFSLYNTLGKLVAPASTGEIACVHGVRAIATVALLLAHKFLPIGLTPYTNRLKISELVSSPLLSWCRAGWMFTDCFLLISGTLTSYRKSTSDSMASKLLSRYFRLTPAMLAVLVFYAYIWDNISTGPMWGTLVTRNAELCQQGWWWNLLYVQNYFGFEDMCAPQTHHMAIDFQLTILGGILVWAIQSDVPFSSTVMQLLHLLAAYSRYTTYRDHRLTALAYQGVSVSQLYRTGRLSYTSILHRCSPYLIGLSLGLTLRKSTSISKILSFFGWFICSILWSLVLWAGADSGYFDYRYDVTFAAIYATLAPLATALGFAWIIYAVHKNSSGFLSLVLSSRPLLFISRISYALYLIQFIVYLTNTATVRSPKEFSLTTLVDLQEIFIILLSAILLTITLVIPLQSVPKISFETKTETEEENKAEKETIEHNDTQNKVENDIKTEKDQVIREVPQRRSFMAHREVLEEIPEVDVEYEAQRDSHEALEEILEEEDDLDEEMEEREDEDLEIIEEEQGEDEEGPEGNEYLSRSITGDSEQDIDEWEWTADGNGRGSQHYRYSR
ncbi:nose resistant to fluoxetine protein 6-like [Maniola hyperantus]|uniref:nose resistant to fluoxetine protein 6-like n=1 Tax=Aphantopus hyperantus TaxID=2795564 RepID=UPI0015687815|nr:nose resistant to fluoxetine protein 6-like isoform X1 [Maniola hyperantus]